MQRRSFGLGLLASLTTGARAFDAPMPNSAADIVGASLAPRPDGGLDIHHLATGRGNSI